MMPTADPFEFRQCVNILKSTGIKARSLRELYHAIEKVSAESVFHHTFQYFLKGHTQEYTNDFAHWAGESLEERTLAEELSNLDPYSLSSLDEVRKTLLAVIGNFLQRFPEPRMTFPGDEFFFNETVSLVFPAGITVKNLAEFLMAIKFVDPASIYYHFYDARIRLRAGTDDFSKWIQDSFGNKELAESIRNIDPFMHTIEGIRSHLVEFVETAVRIEMESAGSVQ